MPGYGFSLYDELTDFNFNPTKNFATGNPGANDVAATRRPHSSMAAAMAFRGRETVAAFG